MPPAPGDPTEQTQVANDLYDKQRADGQLNQAESPNQLRQLQSAQALNERASKLPMGFVQDAPWLASWLVTSPLQDEHIEDIGRGLGAAWPWLKSLNGPDGVYLGARAHALSQNDSETQRMHLDAVDAAVQYNANNLAPHPSDVGMGGTGPLPAPPQEAPEQQAREIYALAMGQGLSQEVARYAVIARLARDGIKITDAEKMTDQFASGFGGITRADFQRQPTAADQQLINLAKEVSQTRMGTWQEALKNGLQILSDPRIASMIVAPGATLAFDAAAFAAKEGIHYGTAGIAGGLSLAGAGGQAKNVRDVGKEAEKIAGMGFNLPGQVFGRAADVAIGGTVGAIAALRTGKGLTDWWNQYVWPKALGQGAGNAMDDALGVDRHSQWGQILAAGTDFVAQWYLSSKIMKAVSGLRRGFHDTPIFEPVRPDPIEVDPSLSIEAQDKAISDYQDKLQEYQTRKVGYDNARADLKTDHGRVGRALFDLAYRIRTGGSGQEAFVRYYTDPGARGFQVFKDIQSLADRNPETAIPRIKEVLGKTMSVDEVQRIVNAPTAAEKARTFLSLLDHRPDPETVRRLDEQISSLQQQIKSAASAERRARFDNAVIDKWANNLPQGVDKFEAIASADPTVKAAWERQHGTPDNPNAPSARRVLLRGRLANIQWQRDNLGTNDVVFKYPKLSRPRLLVQQLRDSSFGEKLTTATNLVIYRKQGGPRVPVPHISRLLDALHSNSFEEQFGPNAREGSLSRNYEFADKVLRRAGVDTFERQTLLNRLTKLQNGHDLERWSIDFIHGIRDSKAVAEDMKPMFDRAWQVNTDSKARSTYGEVVPTGSIKHEVQNGIIQRQAQGGRGIATRPGISAEQANRFPTIDIGLITDATSFTRSMDRLAMHGGESAAKRLEALNTELESRKNQLEGTTDVHGNVVKVRETERRHLTERIAELEAKIAKTETAGAHLRLVGRAARPLHWGYKEAHVVSNSVTDVLKPLVLVGRIPAIIERAGIEHRLRMAMSGIPFGGGSGFLSRPFSALRGFDEGGSRDVGIFDLPTDKYGKPDTTALGSMVFDTLRTNEKERWRRQEYNGGAINDEYARAIHLRIMNLQRSPEVRVLLEMDGDVGRWTRWLNDNPHGVKFMEAFKQDLEWGKMTPEDWGRNILKAVDYITGGNQSLRDAIRTGEWGEASAVRNDRGETRGEEYARLSTEIDMSQETILALSQKSAMALARDDTTEHYDYQSKIRAATQVQKDLVERKRALRDHLDETSLTHAFDITDERAFTDRLRATQRSRQYRVPTEVVGRTWELDSSRKTQAEKVSQRIGEMIYRPLRLVGKMDQRISREPFYRVRSRQMFDELTAHGWSPEDAKNLSELRAARETQDFFYNLTARSSSDRFLRNTFWFAPIVESALRAWLVDIPSRYYWPLGIGYIAARARMVTQFLKNSGLMKDQTLPDGSKQPYLAIPGGKWLSKWMGSEVTDVLSMNPRQLSLLTSSEKGVGPFSIPAVSPQLGYGLYKLGQEHGGVLKSVSDTIQPAGGSFFPSWLNDGIEAFSHGPSPLRHLSWGYTRYQGDIALLHAQNMAVTTLAKEGHLTPRIDQFVNPETGAVDDAAYGRAMLAYNKAVQAETRHFFGVTAWITLLGATVLPAPIHVSDEFRDSVSKMRLAVYGPNDDRVPKDTASKAYQDWAVWRNQQLEKWRTDHPYAFAYLQGMTELSPDYTPIPGRDPKQSSFYDQLYTGYRKILDPEVRLALVSGWESYDFWRADRQGKLAGAVGVPWDQITASDLINHWWDYKLASAHSDQDWDRFLHDRVTEQSGFTGEFTAHQKNAPGYGMTVLTRTMDELRILADSAGGDESSYHNIKSVMSDVGKQIAALASQTDLPGSSGQVATELKTYYDRVLTPYFNQAQPIYDAITKAKQDPVGDPSLYYNQLRDLNVRYDTDPKLNAGLPPPESMFYNNNPANIRSQLRLTWVTRPLSWLTPFERKIAGYQDVPGLDGFLDQQAKAADQIRRYALDNKISPGTKKYDNLKQQLSDYSNQLAASYGTQVAQAWRLSTLPPYARLQAVDKNLANDQRWNEIVQAVTTIEGFAQRDGKSLKSDTVWNTPMKDSLFQAIDGFVTKGSPQFDQGLYDLFQELSTAVATRAVPVRLGGSLYDAIFFDNFSPYGYQARYPNR